MEFNETNLEKLEKSLSDNYKQLKGSSSFKNSYDENQIILEYVFDEKNGKIKINGGLKPDWRNETYIEFDIDSDQSAIPFLTKSMRDGLKKIKLL